MNSLKFSQPNLVNSYLQINTVKYDADQEITNIYENLQIPVFHRYATIRLYSGYFEYLLVYLYLNLLAMNTNEHLFGHFGLFIVFGQVFD